MAVFLNNHDTLNVLAELNNKDVQETPSTLSPISTTILAEGYTDDLQLSRYENVR